MVKIFMSIGLWSLWLVNLGAQDVQKNFSHVVSVNVLAIPVTTGVLAYERFWNGQAVWLGLENRFNGWVENDNQTVRSAALEYRRYFWGEDLAPAGVFAGLYSKYRTGDEFSVEIPQDFHRYNALFAGANAGYQYRFRALFASAFVGIGFPLWLEEDHALSGSGAALNKGYDQDLRIGLTIGLGF